MSIKAKSRFKLKNSKTNVSEGQLYMEVLVYNNGLLDETIRISTGHTILKNRWDGQKITMAKKDDFDTELLNEKITGYKTTTYDLLNELKVKKIESVQEYKTEIRNILKVRLTGKVSRGRVKEQISKLQTYSFEYVLNHKLANEILSVERVRQYKLILEHIKKHFDDKVPTMDVWTEADMIGIKRYFINRKIMLNTLATRLSCVVAVVKYAIKLKIITSNPIPSKYVTSFVDGKRQVLTEDECLKFIQLDDTKLTKSERRGKYLLIVQMLTGIGYGDLKTLEYKHIINHPDFGRLLEKERNKTGKPFKVYLSEAAWYNLQKLIQLTGSEERPINLPDIAYINRLYQRFADDLKILKTVRTYTLRHTFAVNYMDKDGSIEDLQKMLGHAKATTTQIYGKISDQRLSEKMKQHQSKSVLHRLQADQV